MAIGFFDIILVREEKMIDDEELVHHERIHFVQQWETLIIGFYLIYFLHGLYLLCRGMKFRQIFDEVCLEREAYRNEKDVLYLRRRELFSFSRREYFKLDRQKNQ
jgi:hypothetical protein